MEKERERESVSENKQVHWRGKNEKVRVGPGELFDIFHPATFKVLLLDSLVIQTNKCISFVFLKIV